MPWSTPTLLSVRQQNRDYIAAKLGVAILPNGEVRVLADANGGNAHLNLQYLDWQALQYLPDTAEQQFLDKWATIYLVNADGSRGRKSATFAAGTATINGIPGTVFPAGSQLLYGNVGFETTAAITIGPGATPVSVRALDAGAVGNLAPGATLAIAVAVAGIFGTGGAAVISLTGGADEETDDELRVRVLQRIRQPPMGGDADDYVAWALEVAGVTRAWCSPIEMGMGTVTVRFMCDDLRAGQGGFPLPVDVAAVQAYLNSVRPVTADVFALAPLAQPVSFTVQALAGDSPALRGAIAVRVAAMLARKAAPASQTNGLGIPAVNIPSAWVNDAIYVAVGGVSYDLVMTDAIMANAGSLAVLGSIG